MMITNLMILIISASSILIFPTTIHASQPDNPCPQNMCSSSPASPPIRFPFFLQEKNQPAEDISCRGYSSGYRLYCDEMNRTILHLPSSSSRVEVKNIDYSSQKIQVQSLQSCFAEQSRVLDVSSTPFEFSYFRQNVNRYSLFNCSNGYENYYFIRVNCLDDHGYKVVAMERDQPIWNVVDSMESCTKMYDTNSSVPGGILGLKSMNLSWSLPECTSCEVRGGRCGWKNNTIGCFGGDQDHSHSGKWMALRTSGSIIGCLSVIIAIAAVFHVYSRYTQEKENNRRLKKFLEDYNAMKPTRYSYAEIKKITNDFKDKLGEGGYGNVFKGKVSNEVLVAVKLLHDSTTRNGEEFINEVGTMGAIHHVNVVRLLGFCADGCKRALIYEFLTNGSLDKFIFPNGEEHHTLGMGMLEEIAIGIARGIEYLHQGCEQRILHFDIKPHNILLDKEYNPKISDFGLAKLCEKGRSAVSMTAARGTMGYIAPEVFSRHFGNVTYKSDIYSFGMLLLEMVGRRKNIDSTVPNASQVYFPEWIYGCLIHGEELRIKVDDDEEAQTAKKLAIVGLWCIQWNPVDRPSITFVLQMLQGSGEELDLPPNPFTSDNLPQNSAEPSKLRRKPMGSGLSVISEAE